MDPDAENSEVENGGTGNGDAGKSGAAEGPGPDVSGDLNSRFSWLPRFAVTHPVTVAMALAGLLVLGGITYFKLPLELMPSGRTHSVMRVEAFYRGAAPQDLLDQVLDPAEEALRSLSGLKEIITTAGFERGNIRLVFHRGTDMNAAYLSLREKLERIRGRLPDDFKRFSIRRWGSGNWPILWGRIIPDPQAMTDLAVLLPALERMLARIPGVARVDTFGWASQEVAVLVDPEAMSALKVRPSRLSRAIRGENFALPLGLLENKDGALPVRALARLRGLDAVRSLPLAPVSIIVAEPAGSRADVPARPSTNTAANAKKPVLRVRDVARVGLRDMPMRYHTRVDGKPAILLAVYKQDSANTVTVGEALQTTFAETLPAHPQLRRLEVLPIFSQAAIIRDSLNNLQQTALWGGIFAFAVLWLFLRGWRLTLLVISAIPLSILGTLVAMYFLGLTLNLITITGLMLALGMLVDNAVVVVENTGRLRAAGVPAAQASVAGAGEVGLAVLTGTLTTIIVFLPLPFLGGRAFLSFLFRHIGWPITLSLLVSLAVALLVMPLATRLLSASAMPPPPRWLVALRAGYRRVLARVISRPLDAAVLLMVVLMTVAIPLSNLQWNLFGSRSQRRVRVWFQHDPVYNLSDVEAFFTRLQEKMRPHRERLGIAYDLVRFNREGGSMSLFMRPEDTRALKGKQLTRALRELIGEHPGVSYSLAASGGGEETPTLSVTLSGQDPQRLEQLVRRVSRQLEDAPGLGPFVYEDTRTPDLLVVSIRREAAERHGVGAREIANRISAALRGMTNLPQVLMKEGQREIVVQQQQQESRGLELLANLRIWSRGGAQLTLSEVADLKIRESPARIVRYNGVVSLTIEAPIEGENLSAIEADLRGRLSAMSLPQGVKWNLGEAVRGVREDRRSLGVGLVLALAAILLVMGVLFESYLLPLAVLTTVPLALFGSAWVVYLTGTALDTPGMIGIVILVGVVVNNGIVLVDRINRNRLAGQELNEAIVRAGEERFRPILMTALTTVFGLLPMAFGYTNVAGFSFSALGRVVAGGLLASTVLTLFVVPLVYLGLTRLTQTSRALLGHGAE
ncbi:MAG: efflux RND transporter permease subunit [SAR324 cluster bacterium]|nr:efflux RND transporter permease subunit [SAR324 cluster bacterium]